MVQQFAKRFGALFMQSTLVAFAVVLVAVELIVAAYYSYFEPRRLAFELEITAVITALAGLPAIWYFVRQHRQLAALSRQLEQLNSTDHMTGLLNRQAFLKQVNELVAAAPKDRSAGAFAYLDADRFKQINDRFGHAEGDKVIKLIADTIAGSTRRRDLCARLGGEEFGIFLLGVTVEQAGHVAERLRQEISARQKAEGNPAIPLSVSIGIAAHRRGDTIDATMKEADRSLYAAKKSGRDAVVVELKRYRAA